MTTDIQQAAAVAKPKEGNEAAADAPPADDGSDDQEDNNADNDNDDDTASTDPIIDDDDDNKGVSPEEAERLLTEAVSLKEQGNGHFQTSKLDDAVRCYRRGCHRLKKLKRGPVESVDPQVVSLWVTCSTNLATALYAQAKYKACVAAASQALEMQPTHVKARYRRAVAARRMGDSDGAVADLTAALAVEPAHAACVKELRAVRTAIKQATATQKKALSAAFSAGVSLYEDKAGPTPPTPEELQAAAAAEQAALEADKQKWEDDCVSRMARNEPAIGFDDWQKEQQAVREKEAKQKEQERKRKEKEERQKRAAAKKSTSNDDSHNSSSDEDLTEAELQALRGYKKTKDGRVTSYFTRELPPEEKAMLAAQGPQKLSTDGSHTSSDNAPTPLDGAKKKGPSAWNRAGTWEEKDCTAWCNERLQERLMQAQTSSCQIVKVDSLTGDASIVWTKGQQRHVFDFHATLHYSWQSGSSNTTTATTTADGGDDEKKKKKAKGIVKLPEISSTTTQEGLEVIFDGWKRAPASQDVSQAVADRSDLEQALQQSVQAWLQDFHDHYRAH